MSAPNVHAAVGGGGQPGEPSASVYFPALLPDDLHPALSPALGPALPLPANFTPSYQPNTSSAAPVPTTARSPPAAEPPPARGKKRRQEARELRRVTSKRYRDALGGLYAELERLVPAVLPAARLRTKSQIIARAADALRILAIANARAEARATLHAPAARAAWVDAVVRTVGGGGEGGVGVRVGAAVSMLARLVVAYRWAYAEVWAAEVRMEREGRGQMAGGERIFALRDYVRGEGGEGREGFSAGSAGLAFRSGDGSQVGRVAAGAEPEWRVLGCSGEAGGEGCDTSGLREDAARGVGFVVSCALPVLVCGRVEAVLVLFHDSFSVEDRPHLAVAVDLAASLGDCLSGQASLAKEPQHYLAGV